MSTIKNKNKNVVVFGVSADTVESHKGFVTKEHLNFPLLADPDKKMIAAYGVLLPAGYAERVTFVIGPDGNIRQIDRAVSAEFTRQGNSLTSRHGQDVALLVSNWRAQIGQPVPNFSLTGTDGKPVPLFSPGKKAAVVIFLIPHSPATRAYSERLSALASDPAYKDVGFLGIDSGRGETATNVSEQAEQAHYPFPIGLDANGAMAGHFRANVAPTVWVINGKGIAVYHGAIDHSVDPAKVRTMYLKQALDETLADKPVTTPETKAVGDRIEIRR